MVTFANKFLFNSLRNVHEERVYCMVKSDATHTAFLYSKFKTKVNWSKSFMPSHLKFMSRETALYTSYCPGNLKSHNGI